MTLLIGHPIMEQLLGTGGFPFHPAGLQNMQQQMHRLNAANPLFAGQLIGIQPEDDRDLYLHSVARRASPEPEPEPTPTRRPNLTPWSGAHARRRYRRWY